MVKEGENVTEPPTAELGPAELLVNDGARLRLASVTRSNPLLKLQDHEGMDEITEEC